MIKSGHNPPRVLIAWSSGKDSAWTLQVLRQAGEVEVVGLLTTFNEAFDRVAMHGVRRALLEAQAQAADLPLWTLPIPYPCSNEDYERIMGAFVAEQVAAQPRQLRQCDACVGGHRNIQRLQRLTEEYGETDYANQAQQIALSVPETPPPADSL